MHFTLLCSFFLEIWLYNLNILCCLIISSAPNISLSIGVILGGQRGPDSPTFLEWEDSLSDYVVSSETVNTFKRRLDKFWSDQDVL